MYKAQRIKSPVKLLSEDKIDPLWHMGQVMTRALVRQVFEATMPNGLDKQLTDSIAALARHKF